MKHRKHGIRLYLTFLVLVAAIPFASLLVLQSYYDAAEAVQREANASSRIAEQTARFVAHFLDDTRLVLEAVARKQSQLFDPAVCQAIATTVASINPAYANLVVRDSRDNLICAVLEGTPSHSTDRDSQRRVLSEKRFIVSAPLVGPASGRWVVIAQQPILDATGEIAGIIYLPLDLLNFQQLISGLTMQQGGVISVTTTEGFVVARSLDPEKWVGKNVSEMGIVTARAERIQGQITGLGVDGIERAYGFMTIPAVGWRVASGIPTETIYAPVRQLLFRSIAIMIAIIAFVVLLSVRIGRFIAFPIQNLAETVNAVASGRTDARAVVSGPAETAEVAKEFNLMLDASERTTIDLRRLNRALRTISEVNKALVRATDEQTLFNDTCHILVKYGGYRMAWVGLAEANEAKTVRPVAQSGYEAGYLETVRITWADNEHGRGPTGTAIRTGKVTLTKNIQVDPLYLPWREDARKRGYAATASLPLTEANQVLGTLNLYAAEPDAFDDEETELLIGLANDLSYGIVSLRRIERQKRAEQALRESEADYHDLYENAPDMYLSVDSTSGRILQCNQATVATTGYTRDEIIGRHVFDMYHPECAEIVRKAFAQFALAGALRDVELQVCRKDGSRIDVSLSASAVRDAAGKVLQSRSIWRDITARKRSAQMQAQLAAIVTTSNDAIVSRAPDDTIVSWNAAAEHMFGWTAQEALGKSFRSLLLQAPDTIRKRRFEKVLRGETVQTVEDIRLRKDGTRVHVQTTMSAVKNEQGEILFVSCIMRDITERKQAEEALRTYAERMQDLSKRLMESEEAERRNISREMHDSIGQNLSALNLQLGAMRTYLTKGSPQAASARLDDAQKLLEATTRRVRNIMAELRPAEIDDYGLLPALRSYCADYARRFELLVVVTGEDIAPRLVPATEMALFRITQEALNNVLKHARATRVELSLVITPERVTLTVADDGVGFDPALRSTAAVSLGMTTMKERAEAVGARLRIESAPGNGTRVVVEAARARA